MVSKDVNVDTLFSSTKRYRVPLYQRYYVWNIINWEHLWNDIQTKSQLRFDDEESAKTHFTGAIVTQSEAKNFEEIIDGQQRLTTFQIILCAIRDICKTFDRDPEGIAKEAQVRVLNNASRVSKPEQIYKLLPREGADRQTFQFLVNPEQNREEKYDKSGLIYGTYDHFKNRIETYVAGNYCKISSLYWTILKDFMFVQIQLDSGDEYARIFESINGRGQHLDQFDLLRHDLFLRAGTGRERDRLYTKYWTLFEKAETFWRRDKNVDDFLTNFLKVKLEEGLDDQRSLYDQYQQYCKKLTEEFNSDKLVEYEFYDLSRYAESYEKIKDPDSDSEICNRMQSYYDLKIDDLLIPLILYIMSEFRISGAELDNILRFLESYTTRSLFSQYEYYFRVRLEEKINSFFNDKKSFSLVDLVYLFSDEWSTNQKVKSVLKQRLHDDSGSNFILNQIRNNSSDLEDLELFNLFSERWPSIETMLQSSLEGALPIVYSKSLGSAEVVPQLAPYKFMTYDGIKELSKYEVCKDKIVGTNIDRENGAKNVLEIEEILFAFPTTEISNLELYLNDNVKDQDFTREPKPDPSQFKNWLWLCADLTGDLHSKHWFLPNIDATIVTRAGHVLQGTLKSFNDDAIYMQINEQTITVYMHGLYKISINTELSSEYFVMTSDGAKIVLKPEIYRDKVVGTGPHGGISEETELPMDNVLFISQTTNLKPKYINDLQDKKVSRVDDRLLESTKLRHTKAQVITIAQQVLQGYIRDYDDSSIYMQIGEGAVILHRRCIYNFKEMVETSETSDTEIVEAPETSKKQQWRFMVESSKRKRPFKFVTFNEVIQLSEIQTEHNIVTGIPEGSGERLQMDKQDILFAYRVDDAKIVEPLDLWNGEEETRLEPSASDVTTIITGSKYVLRGKQVGFDDETIHLRIQNQTTAIVFKHGLPQEVSLEEVQPKDTKITGHIQSITDSGAFVEIGENFERRGLKEGDEVEVVVLQDEQVHLEFGELRWISMIESQTIIFISDGASKQLSQISVSEGKVNGIDTKHRMVGLNLNEILFAYSREAFQALKDHTRKDKSVTVQEPEKFQVDDTTLDLAVGNQVKAITRATHGLQGIMEGFDKEAIYMKIDKQKVIVFRHGLCDFKIDRNESN